MRVTDRPHRRQRSLVKAIIVIADLTVAIVLASQIAVHGVQDRVLVIVTGCLAIVALIRLWLAVRKSECEAAEYDRTPSQSKAPPRH
jgi:hypothetical protein